MDFKKFAGFLLAMLTFCSTAPVSEAADITDEAELTQLMTVDGGSGTILNDISTASAIENSVDVVLASSAGNKFTLSGQGITIATGKSLTLYDIGITNALNFVGSSSLIIGNGAETQGVSLGSIAGTASILINSSMPVTFTEFVNAASFTVDSNSTSTVALNNGLTLSSNYSQNGGTVNVADGKVVNAKEVQLNGGELILGASSVLSATDTANGKVTVSGGKINSTSGNKSGVIKATTGYQQTGDGSVVNAETLSVENGSATLAGGTLTVTNLGTNSSKVSGNYTQTNGTLVADNAYIGGNATISGGQATVNKYATVDGNVTVSGGSLTLKDGTAVDSTMMRAGGTFNVNGGTVKVGNNSVLEVENDITAKGNINLGSNANVVSKSGSLTIDGVSVENSDKTAVLDINKTYIQKGNSTVTVAKINAKDVDIQGGMLNVSTLGTSGSALSGSYTQSGATSNVTTDNLYTTGDITLSAGTLKVSSNLNSGSNINVNGTLNLGGSAQATGDYNQTGGSTTVADGMSISGANVSVSGGTVALGKGSIIESKTGDVTISGSSSVTNASGSGSIKTANDYIQKGTSQVKVDTLTSGNDINISGGTLNSTTTSASGDLIVSGGTFNALGDTTVTGSLKQSGGKINSVANNIQVANGVEMTGGELALGNVSNPNISLVVSSGDVSINNASINSTTGTKSGIIQAMSGNYSQLGNSTVNLNGLYAKTVGIQGGSLNTDVIGSKTDSSRTVTSYTQSGTNTKVSTGNLYTNGDITIAGGTLSSGEVISENGNYSQSAGTVTIADSKNLSANSVSLTGGTLNLGNNSVASANTGNFTVDGAIIKDANKSATISTAGNYLQTGDSDVTVKNLLSTGSVTVTGGKLNVTNLGTETSRIGSYSQSGTADVITDYIYTKNDATGNVSIAGGSFTINKGANVGGDFTVSGNGTKFINNASDSNFIVNGKFTQDTGTTSVVGDNKTISAINYEINNGSTLELLKNAKVITSDSFTVDGGTVTDSVDGGNGTGTINAGKLYSQTGSTSNVSVSTILANSSNGAVNVAAGTLTANNIGTSDNKVNTYTQTGGTVNALNGLYTSGNANVSGGSFTSAKVDSAADVTVSGSSTSANITDLNAAGKVNVDNATLTATNIGSADKRIGDYTQNGGVVNSKYIYSTGDITVADGTLNMTAGGNITTASTFAVSGETSNVKLNGTLSAQKFSQSQATVDVADGASIEVSANGAQLQNEAVLNLGSGSSLTTTGGNSSIVVSGGSSIVGGDGILSSAKDYTQTDSTTNVNVRALNVKGSVYIGSDTKSGGTLSAKSIGSALEAPAAYYQYGSNVTTDNLYIGANGATIVSNTSASNGTLTVNNSLSSEGNVSVDGSTLTVGKLLSTSGDLSLSSGKLVSSGDIKAVNYNQNGGSAEIASNKSMTVSNLAIFNAGDLELGNNSSLIADSVSGGIAVSGTSSINNVSSVKEGIISSKGYYNQSTSGVVNVNQIFAGADTSVDNGVNISGSGTLNVNDIGTISNKVGYYKQGVSGTPTVNAAQIQTAGDVVVAGGSLTVSDRIGVNDGTNGVKSYSQSGLGTTVSVGLNGLTSNGDISVAAGTLTSTGDITSTAGKYTQSGSSEVSISGSKKIKVKDTVSLTDSSVLNLGSGTQLVAGNDVSVLDSSVINDTANSATINVTGNYTQSGSASSVQSKYLYTTGNVVVSAGTLTAGTIGDAADKRVANYSQGTDSTSATVTTDSIYSSNNIEVKNGTLTANNVLDATKIIEISKGTVNVNKKATAGDSLKLSGGELNVASNATVTAANYAEISGGSLIFNGNNGIVNAANGSFITKNSGTAVTVEQGTGNVISANEISMTDTALTVKDGTSLSLKGGSVGTQLNSVAAIIGSNATLTVDTTNGNASLTDSSINAGASSTVNIQGNTNFISTTTDLGSGANLNINSANGDVNFDAASKITSSNGNITVSGDSNTVTIAGGVNSDTNKTGNIIKNGKNSLALDSKIYGGTLTVSEGTLSVNDDASFSGAVTIEGNTADNKTAYVTVADGKTLASAGDITVGSIKNYGNTRLDLGVNSTLSGNNINLNAVINAIKSNIIADKANGGNVTIGEKTTLNVSHYDPDGEDLTITRISGNLIKINGGSTINIGAGAKLEYDGTVQSQDAHYNVEKGAQWVATGGEYSNLEYSDAPGGSVLTNAGDVILNSNVTFKDSTATREGGAIYNTGTIRAYYDPNLDAYAQNISFIGNSAGYKSDGSQSAFADQNGGAIYNGYDAATGSNGIIHLGDKTTFNKNKATGSGGAIYNISAGSATEDAVTIGASSTFTENSAMGAGGAIFAGENGKITIGKNATFSNNRAGFDANGLIRNYTDGGAIKVDTNATVSLGSSALFDGNIASNFGGAIANSGNLIFNGTDLKRGEANAVFTSNGKYTSTSGTYITRRGGAIYNTGTITSYDEGANAINGLYKVAFGTSTEGTGNSAEYGGALYNSVADDKVFEIRESSFQGNTAEKDGGAIYNDAGKMSISRTSFIQNTSTENGGAIFNNADLTITTGTVFGDENKGNIANNGGAIYNASKLTIAADEDNQIYFTGNEAKEMGGAIYNAGTINPDASNLLSYTNFYLNKAGDANNDISGLGGAIYNASGNLTIENSIFSENQAVHKNAKGGAIFNAAGAGLTIGNKTVINDNKALSSVEGEYAAGGAIYNQGTLTINEGSTLAFNKTDGMGGAIYNEAGAETTLGSGVIIGGLIDEYYNDQTATAGNEALKGGGIYNEGTLNLGTDKIYIIGNKATEAGGGIFNASADAFSTLNKQLVFYGNTALATDESKFGLGGGFYNDKSAGRVVIEDAAFINNAADIGSAIFNAGDMYIGQKADGEGATKGNYIVGNKKGSAIGNSGTLELVRGWEFGYTESAYPRNAGALWNQDEGIITTRVNVPLVGAPLSIYIHDAGYVDSDGNGAVDGAALHLQNKSAINTIDTTGNLLENTIKYASFKSNIGKRGGALYKSSTPDLYITDTMFNGNSAMAKTENDNNLAGGGAIYNEGTSGTETSKIYLEKSTGFTTNVTTGRGGAIYNGNFGRIEFAPGYQMGETIQGYSNIAEIGGGAIANEGEMQLYIDPTSNRSMYFTYQGGAASTTTGNIYNGKGGALYVANKGIVFTQLQNGDQYQGISNAVFTNNESMQGGALYKDSGTYLMKVQYTQFSGNRGYRDGGAVYNNIGELNIDLDAASNNIFVGNRAGNEIPSIATSGKGGAIYNAGVMSIGNSTQSGSNNDKLFVSNAAIGNEGSGGAIYNTGDLVIKGGVGFYNNQAKQGGAITVDGGSLVLDLEGKDVTFSQNVADLGSAIYIKTGSLTISDATGQGHVAFVDADESKGIIAQTIASGGDSALKITGGFVDFLSDASGYGGSYYQTGGYVTVKNKFLNISDSSMRTVTGGRLYLSEGARLVSDQLLISNVETESNGATIVFDKNSKAKLTDLSALYDEDYATFGYFLYGNDEEGVHKISLRSADVYINDDAEIAKESYIGTAKNTYSVRNLYLSNGAKLNSKINVVSGNNSDDIGATLTLNEGALGSENAGVSLQGYNSKLVINNEKTPILLGGTIDNVKGNTTNSITKSGDGLVTVTGDASGYNGKYVQTAGTVEFTEGAKFFGKTTRADVQGGTLSVANGVKFEDGTVIDISGNSTFATGIESDVDLTGTSGAILNMYDPSVQVNLSQDSTLQVTNNANVNATKDVIRIGNANLQVNSVILGGVDQQGGKGVNVTVNPNTKFILQNDGGVAGQGGVLGFGENVTFKDTNGTEVTPVVQLKDNTQLKFINNNDSNVNMVVQSIDSAENINNAWAEANGDIVKENKGTLYLSGDVNDFHGTLIVKDGEIATNGVQFASDVVHDLSGIKDEANVRVKNVTKNNDIVIVGDITSEKETGRFNLDIQNERGNVVLSNTSTGTNSDIYVKNESVANIVAAGSTNVGNTSVTDKSVLNITNGDSYNVNGNLLIKDSTINLLSGNMNVAGNVSMGSTFNMMNGAINTQNIAGNMVLTGDSDYKIDINPMLNTSDKVVIGGTLSSDTEGTTRTLTVSDYNLITDPVSDYAIFNVFDVKGGIQDVQFATNKQMTSTPIANYMFAPTGNGSYMLARTGFTPSAMAAPVAVQVGGYLSQIATYDAAFGNLDTVMALPVVGYDGNRYANADMDETVVYSPLFIPELEKGIWFRPYGNFESVDLQDGPKVSNQSYGALVGGDTPLTELGNGFQGTLSGYIGYSGAHQTFEGISSNQNGGVIGATGAIYKGGFFSGLTINANAGFSNASTLYGKQDFFMLSAGIASKTGYNWELARGKFIIQPSWLMSYSFVNAFDDPSVGGTKLESKALHGVQLAPGIKLMANLPQGWQPYLLFDFRFNLGDETHFNAGLIDLPDTYVKPYVEYGLGMQKRWGDRFTGFGQFLARGGGRNGVGLNLGLRWSVGQGR